uniref:Large ribosomal subunit protein bL20c n=1 Tax=Compsopogon caeruleus TaxID=31354 RepID=A0A1Z1XB27_9RHOD|nr:chloroplast 50S ribosomal protein L20 [Compsopogon caeruleus]ARX96073.1 chloroplast 50S ribosomal protein L20 [Compsopogon caeruleus]
MMTRIKRGNIARKRRQKILKCARGFQGAHSNLFRVANQQVMKALRYSYIGRKQKKRNFRSLWIIRINAASHEQGLKYSQLISCLKKANIDINRKMLSQLAILDTLAFSKLCEYSKN